MVFLGFLAAPTVQLVPDGTILIHIALILLMIWFLNRTLFKPINKVLEERARNSGGRSTEAQQILQQSNEKLSLYEAGLREARTEGYQLIEQQRADALSLRQQQVEAVKAEVADTVAGEKDALQKQVDAARAQLEKDAREIAGKISANILQRSTAK
jgi:F-type H+-transporting ATPase subunit b